MRSSSLGNKSDRKHVTSPQRSIQFYHSLKQAQAGSSHSAPEVRLGSYCGTASDVYSLGILMLQLLTGSEAGGLLEYVQRAVDRGRMEDVTDPCAGGMPEPEALQLAKLALRQVN